MSMANMCEDKWSLCLIATASYIAYLCIQVSGADTVIWSLFLYHRMKAQIENILSLSLIGLLRSKKCAYKWSIYILQLNCVTRKIEH